VIAKTSILDHFVFEEYKTSASSLGLYRILFAGYVLLLVFPQHLWVSNFPNSFFNPPVGVTAFFTGFPDSRFFLIINALSILAAVWLLFGYHTGIASISLALLWLTGNCWAYSFGKINHDILLILTLPVMQAAGWGREYSMDAFRYPSVAEKQTRPWAIALMALIVALAMLTAAWAKFASGWFDPHSHAVQGHLLFNDLVVGRSNWFVKYILPVHLGAFWEFLDDSTVLLESAFMLTVLWRPAFRVVCALACFLHLGIALTMEIAYVANLIVYAAFCNWSVIESRAGNLLRAWNSMLGKLSAPWLLAFSGVIIFVYLRFGGNPVGLLFPDEWDPVGVVICTLGALVAAVFLLGVIRELTHHKLTRAS